MKDLIVDYDEKCVLQNIAEKHIMSEKAKKRGGMDVHCILFAVDYF